MVQLLQDCQEKHDYFKNLGEGIYLEHYWYLEVLGYHYFPEDWEVQKNCAHLESQQHWGQQDCCIHPWHLGNQEEQLHRTSKGPSMLGEPPSSSLPGILLLLLLFFFSNQAFHSAWEHQGDQQAL